MTIRLTGDLGDLTEFRHRLEEVAESGKRKLLRGMAEESLDLVAEGFDKERDPYGGKWKDNARGGEVLRDKGHLARSFHRKELTANEFTIGSGVDYAAIHQSGGTIRAKNTRRVEYTRRNPRKRKWRKGKGRSGAYVDYMSRRKKGIGAYHNVVAFVKALTFQIGGKWISKAAVTIPQRMMVPSKAKGLPSKWSASFREAFEEYMRRMFG